MPIVTFRKLGHKGRLGNQLFQIAATYAYAREYNYDFVIPKWEYSYFFENLKKYEDNSVLSKDNYSTIIENKFEYKKIPRPNGYRDYNLYGYFQSIEHFKKYEDEIKELFHFKNEIKELYKYITFHVRRNDYLNLKNIYVDLFQTNYYDIIDKLKNEYSNYTIKCISDEKDFCKNNFPKYVDNNKSEMIDFLTMMYSEINVISNSTFSWWASYLNPIGGQKKVYAPKKWFNNDFPDKQLYRDDMILLDVFSK